LIKGKFVGDGRRQLACPPSIFRARHATSDLARVRSVPALRLSCRSPVSVSAGCLIVHIVVSSFGSRTQSIWQAGGRYSWPRCSESIVGVSAQAASKASDLSYSTWRRMCEHPSQCVTFSSSEALPSRARVSRHCRWHGSAFKTGQSNANARRTQTHMARFSA